ncbi:MAG: flagellar filament capping protein FliD [Phycisphaerales bacterium]|nr:flagellar filament capping protein FliD [Phycisphaerales bacterium]
MGSITTGVGLISGIDTASLIQQLLALDAQQKTPILQRIGSYTASKTALLDVNARLLGLSSAAAAFRMDDIFSSVLATSSNESVLTAFASPNTTPGNYQFTVKQLVSTSQMMTRGFVSSSLDPMNLDQLSFEWGNGALDQDTDLSVLNGGDGVARGSIRVTDGNGVEEIVDLTLATTIGEVVNSINSAENIQVQARVEHDRLVLVDASGGGGGLLIQDLGGATTADDLGILGTAADGTITGSIINSLGLDSLISSLNDGNGVFIRDNVADFSIQVGGPEGTVFDIDLGRVDAPINGETLLSDLNDGDGIRINENSDEGDFTIKTSSGEEIVINLGVIFNGDNEVEAEAVTTVEELLDRVNGALTEELGAGQVVMSIRSDKKGFEIVDNLGGGENLEVLGAGPYGDETAEDLGIFTGEGGGSGNTITGSLIPSTVKTARAQTLEEVRQRIFDQTNRTVVMTINNEGNGLALACDKDELVTLLPGAIDGSSFGTQVSEKTLDDLGFSVGGEAISIEGSRVLSGMGTVLMKTLNGGQGLGDASELSVTDQAGNSMTMSDIDTYDTLGELMVALNSNLEASGVDVEFMLNNERNGIRAVDHSGGDMDFIISGDVAESLRIENDNGDSDVRGESLQRKYVGFASELEDLNYGQGVGTGVFRITDSNGVSAEVDIGNDSTSLYDVMREINTRGLEVEARINANGDGLVLVDTNSGTPQTAMKVETVSGTTANDLGILGTADEPGGAINGSYEKVVDLEATDTLEEVIAKVNEANIQVEASLLDTGTGGNPYRIVFSSNITGMEGELVIDSGNVDLGMSILTEAQNAKVFMGEGAGAVLVESSSNHIENIVSGLSLDLVSASTDPVMVNVVRDNDGILEGVNRFVTNFNELIARMNEYDSYDVDNETRGPLLGDSTIARIRSDLYRTLQGPALGVDTQYRYLSEVGIRIGKDGQIEFDEDKFNAAYEANPEAVNNLFTAYESQGSSSETVAPGVTIERVELSYSKLGFGDLFDQLVDKLTNSVDGTVTFADKRFQSLIDSANERIERIDERLLVKQDRLLREFTAMETALAQLQSQQASLGLINQSMAMTQSMFG